MRHDQGLSMPEVLIAVALLLILFAPLLSLFVASRTSVEDSTRRNEALALARAAMDDMVARADWAAIQTEGPYGHPLNTDYTVTVTVTGTSYLKDVLVRVEWPTPRGQRQLELYSRVYKRE